MCCVSAVTDKMHQSVDLFAVISICLLLSVVGCIPRDSTFYEGQVVDEQGNPVQGVSIELCYHGWGWDWSMAGGFPLVMGASYCSDQVITDKFGQYKVVFAGKPSTFVLARHKDWIQLNDVLATDGRVVVARKDLYNQRIERQEREKEKGFRKRKQGETVTDYYCRVIQRRSDKVDLMYRGDRITITQSLLANQGKVVFGVSGPYDIIQVLSGDIDLLEQAPDGRPRSLIKNFETLSEQDVCGDNTYFIISSARKSPKFFDTAGSLIMQVESVRAGFRTKVWNHE